MRVLPSLCGVPLLLLTLACSKGDYSERRAYLINPSAASGAAPQGDIANSSGSSVGMANTTEKSVDQLVTTDSAPITSTSMIIRTGQASIEVTSVDTASARIRVLAQHLGGYVANSTFQGGKNQIRSATLELKIPAARFDEAIAGLHPVGTVESVNVTAEDVGEEFVDVTARLSNARKLEQRLLDLLAQRTGKLSDVLEVEQSLSKVREEIERYEGRLRYLRTRAATSTLTVTVHERAPILDQDVGQNPITEAFKSAWRNLIDFISGFIAFSGFLIPLAILAVCVFWLTKRFRRPRP